MIRVLCFMQSYLYFSFIRIMHTVFTVWFSVYFLAV